MKQELLTFALVGGSVALGYLAGFRAGRRSQARDFSEATNKLATESDKLETAVKEFPSNVDGERKEKGKHT